MGIIDLRPEYVWVGYNSRPKRVKIPEPSEEDVREFLGVLMAAGIEVRGKDMRGIEVPEVM